MTFTLQIFLFVFYGFLAVWSLFFLIALYHMFKYGFKNLTTVFAVIFFIGIAVAILNISFGYIDEVDWGQEIEIGNFWDRDTETEIY